MVVITLRQNSIVLAMFKVHEIVGIDENVTMFGDVIKHYVQTNVRSVVPYGGILVVETLTMSPV